MTAGVPKTNAEQLVIKLKIVIQIPADNFSCLGSSRNLVARKLLVRDIGIGLRIGIDKNHVAVFFDLAVEQ